MALSPLTILPSSPEKVIPALSISISEKGSLILPDGTEMKIIIHKNDGTSSDLKSLLDNKDDWEELTKTIEAFIQPIFSQMERENKINEFKKGVSITKEKTLDLNNATLLNHDKNLELKISSFLTSLNSPPVPPKPTASPKPSSPYQLSIATWNIGRCWDFDNLYKRKTHGPKYSPQRGSTPSIDVGVLENQRRILLKKEIKKLQQASDGILLLQEVGFQTRNKKTNNNDPFLKKLGIAPNDNAIKTANHLFAKNLLGNQNWTYSYDESDTLIAWDKRKFTPLNNSTTHNLRGGWVDLRDNTTNKVIRVASAHLKGLPLTNPTPAKGRGGDKQLNDLSNSMLRATSPVDLMVIGMDANTTPTIYSERLDILRNKGFQRDETDNSSTAFNADLSTSTQAKCVRLDYLFGRASNGNSISSINTVNGGLTALEDPTNNPSDHRPIIKKFTLV